MIFQSITFSQFGTISRRSQHDSRTLEGQWVAAFARMLLNHGRGFRRPIPVEGYSHIELEWISEHPSAATATFNSHFTVALRSVLVSGRDRYADHQAILRMPFVSAAPLYAGGVHPLVASIPSADPNGSVDVPVINCMNRYLAAAFFEGVSQAIGRWSWRAPGESRIGPQRAARGNSWSESIGPVLHP